MLDVMIQQSATTQPTEATLAARSSDRRGPAFEQWLDVAADAGPVEPDPPTFEQDDPSELAGGWDTAASPVAEAPAAAGASTQGAAEQAATPTDANTGGGEAAPTDQTQSQQVEISPVYAMQKFELDVLENPSPSLLEIPAPEAPGAEPTVMSGTEPAADAVLNPGNSTRPQDLFQLALGTSAQEVEIEVAASPVGAEQDPLQATQSLSRPLPAEVEGISAPQPAGHDAASPEAREESPASLAVQPLAMPSPEGEASTGGGADVPVMDRPVAVGESAPTSEAAAELPTPDVDRLATTMVRWQHLGVLGRGGSARIRLSPPELGSVEVALRTAGNVVRVHVTVQSESVQQLLNNHSDRLIQSLQTQGLQAGRIEVVVQTPADQGAEQGDYEGADRGDYQGEDQDERGGGSRRQQSQQESRTFASEMQDELNVTG